MIWRLLVQDQWALWPPLSVILTIFSKEAPLGSVRVEGGVGHLQLVSVSRTDLYTVYLWNLNVCSLFQEIVLIYHH